MKTLLVVGSSSDMGSKLIEKIKDNYDCVWAHFYGWNENMDRLKSINNGNIHFIEYNLTSTEEVEKMINLIEESGNIPNNIVHFAMSKLCINKFNKLSLEKMDMDWKICFDSIVMILQSFLPKMQKDKYGRIVFTLSSVTLGVPPKYEAGYVSIKYAMLGLMKSLAAEYGDKGIFVNGVSPDMVRTSFISDVPQLLVDQYAFEKPKKDILSVDDVIPTFVSLLSDDNELNGENILIDQ